MHILYSNLCTFSVQMTVFYTLVTHICMFFLNKIFCFKLKYNWPITLYLFQVYSVMSQYLYIL